MKSDIAIWNIVADRLDAAAQAHRAGAERMSTTVPTKTGEDVAIATAEAAVKRSIADTLEGLANDIRQVLQEEASQ